MLPGIRAIQSACRTGLIYLRFLMLDLEWRVDPKRRGNLFPTNVGADDGFPFRLPAE